MTSHRGRSRHGRAPLGVVLAALAAVACQPRVAVEAPKDPIVIHMNVKIEHEIRVQVDRDLEQLIASEEDLF